ncbi:MAG: imidazole glycerol phosphate synthase subunit HisH [Candidatus Poseidoniales archaeon]
MIIIIDYGLGNLGSISKALDRIGYENRISRNLKNINPGDKFILPGVGHFEKGIKNLSKFNLINKLNDFVLIKKHSILGICLGMQLMTNFSEEGNCNGLGWVDASVKRFVFNSTNFKLPHMGWNSLNIKKNDSLFLRFDLDERFYFVHSYYVDCNEKNIISSTSNYYLEFCSSFSKENIHGVQFHPEKSHDSGLRLLRNFLET